jgi:hypothetical protein
MPSQFRNRGDRLVFSNGIIILSVAASLLVYAFDADLTRLIQLYVVGVFTAFIRHLGRRSGFWLKVRLFFEVGIVVTDVPLLPEERASMSARPMEPIRHVVLIPVSSVHAATVRAVSYALSLEAAEIEAVFLSTDAGDEQELAGAWIDWQMGIPLAIVDAPFRDLSEPMLEEVRRHTAREGTIVTVVLPELVVAHWWDQLLHGQSALFFKRLLLFEPGVSSRAFPSTSPRSSRGSRPNPFPLIGDCR